MLNITVYNRYDGLQGVLMVMEINSWCIHIFQKCIVLIAYMPNDTQVPEKVHSNKSNYGTIGVIFQAKTSKDICSE